MPKKLFFKASIRVQVFKDEAPVVPFHSKLIITRWETWLNAMVYYTNNLIGICRMFNILDSKNGVTIEKCYTLLKDPSIETN